MRKFLVQSGFWRSLLWCLLVHGAASGQTDDQSKLLDPDLYFYDNPESSPVLEYKGHHKEPNKGDFTKSRNPRIVNLYGAHCPACKDFRDDYVRLAKKVQATPGAENVEFYALSCVPFQSLCHGGKYKVGGFPTLLAFTSNDGSESSGTPLKIKRSYKVNDVLAALGIVAPSKDAKSQTTKAATATTERKLEEKNDGDNSLAAAEDGGNGNDGAEEEDGEGKGDAEGMDRNKVNEGGKDEGQQKDEGNGKGGGGEKKIGKSRKEVKEKREGQRKKERKEKKEASHKEDGDEKADDSGTNQDDDASRVATAKDSLEKNTGMEDAEEKNDDETDDAEDSKASSKLDSRTEKEVPLPPIEPIRLDINQNTGTTTSEKIEISSTESLGRTIPRVKRLPRIISLNNTDQSAALAAEKFKRDMDRWRELMKDRKKRIEGRRRRFGGTKVYSQSSVAGEAVPATDSMTVSMKAVTKGTKEYEERRQAMLRLVEKLRERRMKREMGKTLNKDSIFVKGNFPYKVEARSPNFVEKQMAMFPIVNKFFRLQPEEENVLDASVSFVHGLKYGVYENRDQPLPEKRKEALKDWLDLLAVSLPPEWGVHSTIEELRFNIDAVAQDHSNLNRILDKSRLAQLTWSWTCSKGKPSAGFSCGFWKLIHIMTIGVAEHRGGLALVEAGVVSSNSRVFSPSEAADVWRNYMAEFFTCTECRTEFVKQYDSCMFRRCDRLNEDADNAKVGEWKELAKYAWEVHNAVSLRVAEKRAKKALVASDAKLENQKKAIFIKVLYPSIEQCFACFKEDGSWNEDAIFLFLEKTYWSGGSVLDPKVTRFLRYDKTYYYQTSQFRSLWWMSIAALVVFLAMRRQINKAALQRTMVVANSIMSHQVVRATGGKLRSN